jgi:hypothetical protein
MKLQEISPPPENLGPAGGGARPLGPNKSNEERLAGSADFAGCLVKPGIDVLAQKRNPGDDNHCNQRHQQAVFHRARTSLIFEKVLDPFHFFIPFSVIGSLWLWVAPVNKLLNFCHWYSC